MLHLIILSRKEVCSTHAKSINPNIPKPLILTLRSRLLGIYFELTRVPKKGYLCQLKICILTQSFHFLISSWIHHSCILAKGYNFGLGWNFDNLGRFDKTPTILLKWGLIQLIIIFNQIWWKSYFWGANLGLFCLHRAPWMVSSPQIWPICLKKWTLHHGTVKSSGRPREHTQPNLGQKRCLRPFSVPPLSDKISKFSPNFGLKIRPSKNNSARWFSLSEIWFS